MSCVGVTIGSPVAGFKRRRPLTYPNGYDPVEAAKDCVVTLEKDSAPRVLFCGEDLLEVKLPAGTRVVYAKPPIPGLRDR